MGCTTSNDILGQSLRSQQTPPFIGLAWLESDQRISAFDKTRSFLKGSSNRLPDLFREFPYVAAWCVTQPLSKSYGETDTAIYKHIEAVLGVSLADNSVRHTLFNCFCPVCENLGLPTRGYGRMVDVYLLHAGVPLSQLSVLIQAFRRQEAAFGPPPTNATVLLNQWEDDSLEFLPPAVTTLRRAILWDETAWHAALFARICENPKTFAAQHPSEKHFFAAFSSVPDGPGLSPLTAMPRPQLVWVGDGLALRLPRVEGRIQAWQDDDNSPLRLWGGEDWLLPQPWPTVLRWKFGNNGDGLKFLSTPTELAIFDHATGYLIKRTGGNPDELVIDTTEAVILSRRAFSLEGQPALEAGESGFLGFIRLGFQPIEIVTDHGVTRLRARPRRRLTFHGDRVANGPRGSLFGRSAVLRVETGFERDDTRHLQVTIGNESVDVEVPVTKGIADVSVGDLLSSHLHAIRLDPVRMRVDLLSPGNKLAVARTSGVSVEAWVWPAFVASDGLVFNSDPGPKTLVLEQSRHVTLNRDGLLTLDHSGGYIAALAMFEIEGSFIPFDLPWPDVVVVRRRSDGSMIEVPMGTRLTLGEENRFDVVTIRCPDPQAVLLVRGRREEGPFSRGQSRNLAVRDLLASASDDRVVLRRANGQELVLFEIVPSVAPESVQFLPARAGLRLRLRLFVPADALALEILYERDKSDFVEIGLGRRPVSARPPSWLSADLPNGDPREIEVTVDARQLADGLALARIFVRPEMGTEDQSTWRPLRNARGDSHAFALASCELEFPNTNLRQRFETLCQWLADCYALECWAQIEKVLVPRWQEVGEAFSATPGGWGALMMAAALPPPEHTATSWIPIAHPIQIQPHLYSAPPIAFAGLSASPDAGVAELARLFTLGRTRLRDQSQLHPTVYLAFRNRVDAEKQDLPLCGFDPSTFFKNLPLVDSDPSAGWFWRGEPILGPDHWRASHLNFLERLESVGMFTSEKVETGPNSRREETLLRFVRAAWERTPEAIRPPVPMRSGVRNEPDNIALWASSALSSFARASRMDEVDEFIAKMCDRLHWSDAEALTTVALLVRLAPELFAFFLLTWQIARERP